MEDKKRTGKLENIILRVSVIGLGLSFIYFGFFIDDFLAMYQVFKFLYFISLVILFGLAIYKIIKRFI